MAQVALQVNPGGSLNAPGAPRLKNMGHQNTAVAASASDVDITGTIVIPPEVEGLAIMLTHDATVGLLTLALQHDQDGGSNFVNVADGIMALNEQSGSVLTPAVGGETLQVDVEPVAGVGPNVVIAPMATAREVQAPNNTLVRQLTDRIRVRVSTDATWDGTEIDIHVVGHSKRHQPGDKQS